MEASYPAAPSAHSAALPCSPSLRPQAKPACTKDIRSETTAGIPSHPQEGGGGLN